MERSTRNYEAAQLLPFELYNIGDFVKEEHPIFHPLYEQDTYLEYWNNQVDTCLKGQWGYDYCEKRKLGGYRWMPGNLYFYINMTQIKIEEDEGRESYSKPRLRDVEWFIFYALAECDGFSGFADDEEFTCYEPVGKLQGKVFNKKGKKVIKLVNKEKIRLERYDEFLRKPNGEYKTYVDPKTYLYRTFDKPMGEAKYFNEMKNLVVLSSRGVGKEQPHSEPVLTDRGWSTMGDISIGDYVIGSDGKKAKVLDKFPQGVKDVYEVTLRDGRKVKAGADHLWKVWDKNRNRAANVSMYSVKTTKELLENYYWDRVDSKHKAKYGEEKYTKEFRYALPLNDSLDIDDRELPIDPYFLGLWLGDGTKHRVGITTEDEEIRNYCYKVAKDYDLSININENKLKTCPTYFLTQGVGKGLKRPLFSKFKKLNLLGNKHIPEDYFFSSTKQRLELLRGLMDTDGTCSGRCVEYYSKDRRLAEDVAKLSRSLGIYTQVKIKRDKVAGKDYGESYRVILKTDLKIFNLKRKNQCHVNSQPTSKSGKSRFEKVFITDIRKLDYQEESSCIMVDNEDHTYLTTDYVVTHNSYSIANGVLQYDFTFGSARNVQEFLDQNYPSVSVAGSFDSKKTDALLKKFEDSYEFMRKNLGSFSDESGEWNCPFYQPYDGSIKVGKNITNRVKEEGGRSFTGTGSELWHVSYKDNASAGVGFRARRMVVEEAGLLSNFKQVHAENSGTQKRETKIGYTVYIGTGGDIEKIQGIRDAFYNPKGYDCVGFKDTFSNKPGMIGLFIPAYYRSIDYKDPQGNTRLAEAFEDEMAEREAKRLEGSTAYEGHIISYPIVPQEMFLQSSTNIFPTELLEDRLTDLETGEWDKIAKPGKLTYSNKERTKVYWQPFDIEDCKIIKRWGDEKDLTDDEKKGTIVVYEHPAKNKPELTHYKYLYLVTYDSIRDEEGGTSLACVQVWKFWYFDDLSKVQFNIVAEWLGRHIGTGGLEKDHEIAFKLAAYYNCPILPEINLKDVLRHGRMTNRYRYFLPRPALALDGMEIDIKGKYPVGIKIVPGMKPDLEKYLNEALHTVVDSEHKLVGNEEFYLDVKMVQQIPSMRFTEELLYYNRDDNFDAVSSGMLFGVAARQRLLEPVQDNLNEDEDENDQEYMDYLQNGEQALSNYNDSHPAFGY